MAKKKINPSKVVEEIDGVEQVAEPQVLLRRPDGYPADFPESMAKQLIADKGFTLAKPEDFAERRARNVKKSFEERNAKTIAEAEQLAGILRASISEQVNAE